MRASRCLTTWFCRVFVALGLASASGCGYEVERLVECPSPSGRYTATFYRIYGGGAAGFQYLHVNVRPAAAPFDEQMYVLQLKGGYDARLIWNGDSALVVHYPSDARVDSAAPYAVLSDTLSVRYSPQPGQDGQLAAGSGCGFEPQP